MSLTVDVRADLSEVRRFTGSLKRRAVHDATRRALNKTATQVRTQASRSIRKKRNLKAGLVNGQLKVRKANFRKLMASVEATGRPIPLIRYGARPKKVKRNGRTYPGVSVMVDRGKRKVVPGGFVAFSGLSPNIYRRKGKARLPVEKLFGPSLPSTFLRDEVVTAMNTKTRDKFPSLLRHEMRREIDKAARKAARR